MLIFRTLTIKNFMSIGERPQTIMFDNAGLTLVLGENLDTNQETNASRNGVGKSAILNALSFSLFGQALTNIRKDNLINAINERNMFVVFEFDKDGHKYRIERGRKPNFFRFFVDDLNASTEDTDEAQGEGRHTQEEIEKIIGFGHSLFRNIIALNTSTAPFLSMSSREQREFIEELLGILQLSQKAEVLKESIKSTKDQLRVEQIRLDAQRENNDRIQKNINDFELRSKAWIKDHKGKCEDLEQAIQDLSNLNINNEIKSHKKLYTWNDLCKAREDEDKLHGRNSKSIKDRQLRVNSLKKQAGDLQEKLCPTCGQGIEDHKHEHISKNVTEQLELLQGEIDTYTQELDSSTKKIQKLDQQMAKIGTKPETFYQSIDEAYAHKNSIEMLEKELENMINQVNPFVEQINLLRSQGLQVLNAETRDALVKLIEHQEFLYKLLTSKDSFVRKKIIDQNLSYLNARLSHYLEKLGLPHLVSFQNDMSVNITYMGRDLDFDNLSRGERTRLILGLSWSFRDIFELLNHPSNLIFIDELLDLGLDTAGADNAMTLIKQMARERGKDIFVVSHREELISKISNVLKVIKEDGFTTVQSISDYAGE